MRPVRTVRVPILERVLSGVFAGGIFGVLLTAARLDASPDGFGTHTQLGLEECSFVEMFGYPCATCGMTTAFTHAADFSLIDALLTQPAGAVFAVASAVAFWVLGYVAATGSPVGRALADFVGMKLVWLGMILLGIAWAYKVWSW
jgi:hypothetical protein